MSTAPAHGTPTPTASSLSLDRRTFVGVTNSPTGQVSGSTRFLYRQDGSVVWADYSGGDIVRGHLIGTLDGDRLHFRYTHLDTDGSTANGAC